MQLLQHIADHAISDSGRRRFLVRSDSEGRTWVSVAGPFRRMPFVHRHTGSTPGETALDPVSVSSDEDDDVTAFASNPLVEPDDTTAAAPGCHHDSESEPDSFPPTFPDATPDVTLDCKSEPSDDVPPLAQVTPESAPSPQNAPSPGSPVQFSACQESDIISGGIPSPHQPAFHDLGPWSSLFLPQGHSPSPGLSLHPSPPQQLPIPRTASLLQFCVSLSLTPWSPHPSPFPRHWTDLPSHPSLHQFLVPLPRDRSLLPVQEATSRPGPTFCPWLPVMRPVLRLNRPTDTHPTSFLPLSYLLPTSPSRANLSHTTPPSPRPSLGPLHPHQSLARPSSRSSVSNQFPHPGSPAPRKPVGALSTAHSDPKPSSPSGSARCRLRCSLHFTTLIQSPSR